jgi:peptide/nickel transport system substrate-binding protein
MKHRHVKLLAASVFLALSVVSEMAQAAGVLTIGRREDSTTFDPIKSAQNADNWVFSNVFDPLVRVDKRDEAGARRGGKLDDFPDGKVYTFKIRDPFSDGTPLTASDAAFSLLRIRDDEGSLWRDSYSIIAKAEARTRARWW